ncbi:MAG: LAGLIDADG family homing endonuclease [Candidatus Pacearchaeota archaeon]
MRLKFVKGKQREMISLLKKDYSWSQLSKLLGVSEGYLRNELRNEVRLLDEVLYRKICKMVNRDFDKFISEKIGDNWGQSKGGKNSKGNTKTIKIPKDSVKLAEFFGIMLGDGNSHKTQFYESRMNKRGTYVIRVVGDSRHDEDYLINYVKSLIEKLFNIKVNSGKFNPKENFKNSRNAMFLVAYGVRLVNFLEEKGFKPGNKIKNRLGIPKWIKENHRFLAACLRGLYDTDGGIYKLNNQNTYQIVFTNFNLTLLRDVKESLEILGIVPSKITKGNKVYITKKSELRKFLKQIGFHNSRHLNKVNKWNF